MPKAKDWFTIDRVDDNTYILSEYGHWEQTHCYLLVGKDRALLIDTGLGICNIAEQASLLTEKPITAVATHVHWDHIGGHKWFSEFYAHQAEQDWLNGHFPLPLQAVKSMVGTCGLPESFDIEKYEIFQGTPVRLLADGDTIDLGERLIQAVHTPGHAPGHLCFWEADRKYLFTGDLVYQGTLYADYPSTDPAAYLRSLEKISVLPAKRIFPGHHRLEISPQIILRMRDAFRALQAAGRLHHGSGTFDYEDWAVRL